MKKDKKKKNLFLKILLSGGIITTSFFMFLIIGVLMILNFFGVKMTVSTVENNYEYADEYLNSLNKYFKNGYVPLSRILYFHLEDERLSIDELYKLNQKEETKSLKNIESVCTSDSLKNMSACLSSSINENSNYVDTFEQYFNFPLKSSDYTVTSFFNEQRYVYDNLNVHNGWDFAIAEQTPVYSVCSGKVINVNFTQDENVPYEESNNNIGNNITIECDDYGDKYYVIFRHLYPNSSKVEIGDSIDHYSEIASVGTTGYSTGNHLHYEVLDKDNNLFDGMLLVDMSLND